MHVKYSKWHGVKVILSKIYKLLIVSTLFQKFNMIKLISLFTQQRNKSKYNINMTYYAREIIQTLVCCELKVKCNG